MCYSPWGHKQSDTNEHTYACTHAHKCLLTKLKIKLACGNKIIHKITKQAKYCRSIRTYKNDKWRPLLFVKASHKENYSKWEKQGKNLNQRMMKAKRLNLNCPCVLSPVGLFMIPWTVARQAPKPVGFSRQEYWSGLPFPPLVNLPDPGMECMPPCPPLSPALQADSLPLSHRGSPQSYCNF